MGLFVFKIRNLLHNCSSKNRNMKLLASPEKAQFTHCFSDQLQRHNDISIVVWLYFQQCHKKSVFISQESRMRLWNSLPKNARYFFLFYFSLCTYFMCTVHVHIYMGLVHIYMGIYVSSWFNCMCTCMYMNVKARG